MSTMLMNPQPCSFHGLEMFRSYVLLCLCTASQGESTATLLSLSDGPPGCGRYLIEKSPSLYAASGHLFDDMASETDDPQIKHFFLRVHEACQELSSVFVKVQFDIMSYVERLLRLGVLSMRLVEMLQRVRDHYLSSATSDLVDILDGVALCMPAACAESSAALYFALGFVFAEFIHAGMLMEDWPLPLQSEINMTLPKEEAELAKLAEKPKAPQAEPSLQAAQANPLAGTGFEVPWWLNCQGPLAPAEWQVFAERVHADFKWLSLILCCRPRSQSIAPSALPS